MNPSLFQFDGSKACKLKQLPTSISPSAVNKEKLAEKTLKNMQRMALLQEAFYADGREGLIILFQALDAAGKDSTIKNVMTSLNPQGVTVYNFKQPNSEELSHDYLWRVNRCLPRRGEIAIFNRSYYEDVLTVQLHDLYKSYRMAPRLLNQDKQDFFHKRYRQICNYEEYLYENSYRVVKIFLHVSKEKQKERFLERIDQPEKNWKFSQSDLKERARFDEYQQLLGQVITRTASPHSPWYVVPADRKWYTRYLVSCITVQALESCCHEYPTLSVPAKEQLQEYRLQLKNEKG